MTSASPAPDLAGATPAAARPARCRFCDAALRTTVVDLGTSPLANDYLRPEDLARPERFYPLRAWLCEACLLVQLEAVETPERIFGDYAYFSSYSDSWLAHAERYAGRMVERFRLSAASRVVEVASNDGYLLQYFLARGVPVLGVEPADNVARAALARGIPTRVEFFGERAARALVAEGIRADLLVGNNVLAHVPALNDFVAGLRVLLHPRGVLTMEFPHLVRLVEEGQFDTIYHEHFSYFSLLAATRIFAHHGLTVFDVEELPTHGGSLRIYARHAEDPGRPVQRRVMELLARETAAGYARPERYVSFAERVHEVKRAFLEFLIHAKRDQRSIAGYGAPAKGNTFLNYCGVRTDFIDYTVDRSPAKQGRHLPGTRIPILHPDHVKATRPDYLLILPWNLRDEIASQMVHIREWGGRFVVAIPEVRVF
jgi:SAM-dependent methyltransferase